MISKFRIWTADSRSELRCIFCCSLHHTIAAQQHLVLLYSGRNTHIFVRSWLESTGKSIKGTQVSLSI